MPADVVWSLRTAADFAFGPLAPGAQMPVGATTSVSPSSAAVPPGPSGPNWPAPAAACCRIVSQVKPRRARRNGPWASLVLNRLSVRCPTQPSQNR